MSFDFKAATPVTSGVTSSYFLFGATSQVASTPSIFDVGAAVGSALATLTNKTFDTAGSGNSFSINGLAATANTGTGAVARETSPTLVTPVINSAAHVGGAWVADATWTLPAITLGGTVSGGGQQLNNIIIGTSTPLAGTFTTLTATTATITQGAITDPATMLSGTVTWNDAADTFTAWKLNVTNTNSAAASLLIDLQVDTVSQFKVNRIGQAFFTYWVATGAQVYDPSGNQNAYFANGIGAFGGSVGIGAAGNAATYDVILARDAANTLALRNSTNAQTFNTYLTYTDASNYARLSLAATGSLGHLRWEDAGSGSASRSIRISPHSSGTQYFEMDVTGAAYATNEIGATPCFTIRKTAVSGVITLLDWSASDFGRLQFGGTTSSFPAIKRTTTYLSMPLADDTLPGLIDAEVFATTQVVTSLSNSSTAVQNVFASTSDVLTLRAATTYFFEALYYINTGNTTHTTAIGFPASSAFTSINYWAELWSTTSGTISTTAPSVLDVAVSTATVLNATSTALRTTIRVKGIIRTNASTTVTPQITFDAGPGGTCEVAVNSFFRAWPVGSNTIAAFGDWA